MIPQCPQWMLWKLLAFPPRHRLWFPTIRQPHDKIVTHAVKMPEKVLALGQQSAVSAWRTTDLGYWPSGIGPVVAQAG
jgi:hypothetical protein